MAVLSVGGGDTSRRRDSIILTFKDAKISVLEYDDSIHGLRTSYVLNGALFGSALLQAEN
ncbi:cleavage and polyadenylation specificity factor subunit 1-like [Sesbania bispinosa]|nr:cleavage and polyadenylation specificity factor subunit 1-like [Sesbania bispinosa]